MRHAIDILNREIEVLESNIAVDAHDVAKAEQNALRQAASNDCRRAVAELTNLVEREERREAAATTV